ncbi:hypothetical protein ABB37_04172 [Leptomonas pyrrhocoris]|uniref:SET domain-containing protein n=1 Tax=Leptomonas pyrrhocoris TaxID=157538 RepID=A0A0N1J4Z2_LEPPY|nr:hypothetical protein ABB37_04172 [Leptomonas pyrrhocoris]XP_015660380.1 hypothetical protein ABB37_04172 [Leptomonas pyrrhocoris]KPA81940.1 hypothetical protein ABB37_04172 [Leptomonas pyrrhocoris]KPA81941.1 hypothetical protein ABB37_04172 [Leptomonas pyrrhocoris]|eukprot:XP_015660379.1 hypothetical protein ABB37_04172 [Leptomonas pyrrhocoris]
MWRQICARLNVMLAPSVERRFIDGKGCSGLACRAADVIEDGEVLAVVPYLACTSPIMALASPWGSQLGAAISSYALEEGGVRVEYSKEGALTTAFTALAMQPRSPLEHYLRHIELNAIDAASLASALGPALATQLKVIEALNGAVVEHMHSDLRGHGVAVPLTDLQRAHRLCASRCLDVPGSEEFFGGPALVPVADLINHDSRPPNIAVYAESTHRIGPLLRRHSRMDLMNDSFKSYAFCVVVRATEEVEGGKELTYQYVDATADPSLYADKLYWASRFGFVPTDLVSAKAEETPA